MLAASNLPGLVPEPLAGDLMGVTVHRLSNGLTVYISTDRQQPRFTAYIAVRTGSRNDPADSTGLAHYLEHMLFKGTDEFGTLDVAAEAEHIEAIAGLYDELRTATDSRRAEIFAEIDGHNQAVAKYAVPNELDRMYASLGIEGVNAFTGDEVTAYVGDVPSNRLEAWAQIEAERFSDPVYRLFFTELEAVYEEKNLSLDNPDNQAWEALLEGLFPAHPYGTQTTIGASEHLKNPAYNDMVAYFEDWYAPNNMAVLLAGDIDPETALPVLEQTLGQIPTRQIATPEPGALPPVEGRVEREVFGEGEQSVTLAWQTLAAKHIDEPVLVVLDWLMDNSRSGLLNVELELGQKVQDAGSWSTSMSEAGYFGVEATLLQGQTHAEAEQMLLEVVAKLAAGEFTQAEIDAIKLHEDMGDKRELENNRARVSRMLDAYIERREWSEVLARDERLRAVTREDVIRVAKQLLGPNYVVVNRKQGKPELPNIAKPTITPIALDTTRESPFAAAIAAMPVTPLEPQWLVEGEHYTHAELPAGPLLVSPNPRNDLFSLSYEFDRGYRKAEMLCVALKLLERSGAGKSSAEDLQKELFALGISVGFSCRADTSGINISGIDANLEAGVALVEGWLRAPSFDDETLAKLRESLVGERKDRLEDPRQLGRLVADYARYGKDAGALSEPSNAALRKVSAKALRKLLTSLPNYAHRTLYFGPRDAEAAAKVVALGAKHKRTGPLPLREFRADAKPGTTTIYFLHREVAKSDISLTMPTAPQARELRPVASYLNAYMGGGMGSLIFQEVREARGLAYYAYGMVSPGSVPKDEWAMVGGMGTQADKTNDALSIYLELWQERSIDANRLEESLTSLEANYRASRVDPRYVMWWVDSWDRRGEKQDPRPWEWEQIQGLGVEEVQSLATSLAGRPVIISIVGDRERVDLEALAKFGTVIELEAEALVSYGAF